LRSVLAYETSGETGYAWSHWRLIVAFVLMATATAAAVVVDRFGYHRSISAVASMREQWVASSSRVVGVVVAGYGAACAAIWIWLRHTRDGRLRSLLLGIIVMELNCLLCLYFFVY
jgi:hypothetical protein